MRALSARMELDPGLIPSFIQRMNWFISRTGSDRYFVISRLLEGVEKRFAPFLDAEFKDISIGGPCERFRDVSDQLR